MRRIRRLALAIFALCVAFWLLKAFGEATGDAPLDPFGAVTACVVAALWCAETGWARLWPPPAQARPAPDCPVAMLFQVERTRVGARVLLDEDGACVARLLPAEARDVAAKLCELADLAEIGAPT